MSYKRPTYKKGETGMKVWQGFLLLVAIVLIVIAGGAYLLLRPGPYAIENGAGRDYLYSIEIRSNGTGVFWTHDSELGAYCATDPAEVAKLAKLVDQLKTRRIELYFKYKSINNGSAAQQAFPGTGCPQEEGGVTMYHATYVEEATG
jgi:hypothetical protein